MEVGDFLGSNFSVSALLKTEKIERNIPSGSFQWNLMIP
jgi:hypothetical protein